MGRLDFKFEPFTIMKLCPTLNERSKSCQSGEFSPNLVTLNLHARDKEICILILLGQLFRLIQGTVSVGGRISVRPVSSLQVWIQLLCYTQITKYFLCWSNPVLLSSRRTVILSQTLSVLCPIF